MKNFNYKKGFSLLELLMVVGIVAVFAALAVTALHSFRLTTDLDNSAEELINVLRIAQQKTIASEAASSWGVYLDTSASPHQYVLFKGADYLSRDISADDVHKLPAAVLISDINLGGGSEIVFNRVFGTSRQQGLVSLTLEADPPHTKTVYIEESGQAGTSAPVAPSDANRIKDSRHAHVDYDRYISTTTEDIILTFSYDSSTQTEIVPIAGNMQAGQIYWEGEINVAGQLQKLKIHTHRLNDPFLKTQFSIHRDMRYNTRALKISVGSDPGTLIEYSADGLNTINTSVYVTSIQWQ